MDVADSQLIACAVVAVAAIPLIAGLVPPNRFYGVRTKRTLADEALWYRANRFGGWALLAAAAVAALLIELAVDSGNTPRGWWTALSLGLAAFASWGHAKVIGREKSPPAA